jgi:hypothetical protein
LESLIAYGVDILTSANPLLWKRGVGCIGAGLDWLTGGAITRLQAAAKRKLRMGDHVTVVGRGIGRVESKFRYFGEACKIRLRNEDLYVVPLQDIVFNDRESQWEVTSANIGKR